MLEMITYQHIILTSNMCAMSMTVNGFTIARFKHIITILSTSRKVIMFNVDTTAEIQVLHIVLLSYIQLFSNKHDQQPFHHNHFLALTQYTLLCYSSPHQQFNKQLVCAVIRLYLVSHAHDSLFVIDYCMVSTCILYTVTVTE